MRGGGGMESTGTTTTRSVSRSNVTFVKGRHENNGARTHCRWTGGAGGGGGAEWLRTPWPGVSVSPLTDGRRAAGGSSSSSGGDGQITSTRPRRRSRGAPWQSPQRRTAAAPPHMKTGAGGGSGRGPTAPAQDGATSGQVPVLVLLIRTLQVLLLYEHVDRLLRDAADRAG